MKESGTVLFWNPSKKYGFVRPDSGGENVFCGCAVLVRCQMPTLQDGDRVSFTRATLRPGVSPEVAGIALLPDAGDMAAYRSARWRAPA